MITVTDGERDACGAHSGSDNKGGGTFIASLVFARTTTSVGTLVLSSRTVCSAGPVCRRVKRRGARVSGDRPGRRPATLVPCYVTLLILYRGTR
jgi:hypothetical protein